MAAHLAQSVVYHCSNAHLFFRVLNLLAQELPPVVPAKAKLCQKAGTFMSVSADEVQLKEA